MGCDEELARALNTQLDCIEDLIACKRAWFEVVIRLEVCLRFSRAFVQVVEGLIGHRQPAQALGADLVRKAYAEAIAQVMNEKDAIVKKFEAFFARWQSDDSPSELFDEVIENLKAEVSRSGRLMA